MILLTNCRTLVGDNLVDCNILANSESGKIEKISKTLDATWAYDERIDCKGMVALPGMIDVHVHFRDPGQEKKEDFYTGSAGAIAGGTTTVIDMPNNAKAVASIAVLTEKIEAISKKSVCDYGLNFGASPTNQAEAALAAKKFSVIKGLKMYLGSSTGDLLVDNNAQAKSHMETFPKDKPVCVHAEDESEIKKMAAELRAKDPEGKIEYHNIIRSPSAASISVQAACDLSSMTHRHVHICHASTKGELDVVDTYKKGGEKISVEVCPHHLFLTENDAVRLGNMGKVNPPLRSRIDVAALWDELSKENSIIDCISTDHAPHTSEEKAKSYWDAPSGIPGVQLRVPLMLDAVNKNLISLRQMVNYCSANPSRLFHLEGKGALKEGMSADITLVNLKEEFTVRVEDQLSKCGYTPYEGKKLVGRVKKTFLRGKLAYDGENICIKGGEGKAL